MTSDRDLLVKNISQLAPKHVFTHCKLLQNLIIATASIAETNFARDVTERILSGVRTVL